MTNHQWPPEQQLIGDGDIYIEQPLLGPQATVKYLFIRSLADHNRVAVDGHSCGAVSIVNLLARCDLYQAGMVCSGAYDRTLTLFS